jgi:hypothetical protein
LVRKRSFFLLGGQRTAHAEADMALPELVKGGSEPTGGATGTGIIAPGAAAYNAFFVVGFLVRPMEIGLWSAGVLGIPITTPLADIPVHLVQPPRIGRQAPYRHGRPTILAPLSVGVGVAAVIVRLVDRKRFTE